MNVLILLVFVSIVLVGGGLLLFFFSLRQRDFEHAERLSLLPLSDPGEAPDSTHARATDSRAGRALRTQESSSLP